MKLYRRSLIIATNLLWYIMFVFVSFSLIHTYYLSYTNLDSIRQDLLLSIGPLVLRTSLYLALIYCFIKVKQILNALAKDTFLTSKTATYFKHLGFATLLFNIYGIGNIAENLHFIITYKDGMSPLDLLIITTHSLFNIHSPFIIALITSAICCTFLLITQTSHKKKTI